MIKYVILIILATSIASGRVRKSDKCKMSKADTMKCVDSTPSDLPKVTNRDVEWLVFVTSNVPVLKKDHLKNFPNLKNLLLEESKLEKIEGDAFLESKHLKWLDVSLNKLTTVPANLFENCPEIYYFSVSGNGELVITQNAPFLNSPDLKSLDMTNAKITKLYSETFSKLDGLRFLYLSGNELTDVPKDLFKPLRHLTWLDLAQNKLKTIDVDVSTYHPIDLYLKDNPWVCDCSLFPMIEWAKTQNLKDDVTCMKPSGKKWAKIMLDCPLVAT